MISPAVVITLFITHQAESAYSVHALSKNKEWIVPAPKAAPFKQTKHRKGIKRAKMQQME